jgi:hypothetical protein
MAELSVGANLTEVDGFPTEEPLRLHEDLVARYGPAKEAVVALVPAQQILAELPRDAAPYGFFLFYFVRFISLKRMAYFCFVSMMICA